MATITVRNLPEHTRRALKELAAKNNRSMEAEARAILESATAPPRVDFIWGWLRDVEELGGDFGGDFELPERSAARGVGIE